MNLEHQCSSLNTHLSHCDSSMILAFGETVGSCLPIPCGLSTESSPPSIKGLHPLPCDQSTQRVPTSAKAKSKLRLISDPTARVILGQVLCIFTCESQTHTKDPGYFLGYFADKCTTQTKDPG